ncbi:MAG: hypothetical protein LDLANPLL_01756 [Turneriella sp.]|nr:hypothetical protein [Turneriella sp.]
MVLAAVQRSELVHDAAAYTGIFVFGALADLRQIETIKAKIEQVVDCKSKGTRNAPRRYAR